MERYENLISFIHELNSEGRIQYEDYSKLFDLASELYGIEDALNAARTDIAALLWMNGDCEYCNHGRKEEFSGATRWGCELGYMDACIPEWRGATIPANTDSKYPGREPNRIQKSVKQSRTERIFGPKETWPAPQVPGGKRGNYKGFLIARCSKCGHIRSFCAKVPITEYRCADCGHKTPLHNLTPMNVTCKCGKHFKYYTNLSDDSFTYTCFSCGAPVDMVYNKKAGAYQTV